MLILLSSVRINTGNIHIFSSECFYIILIDYFTYFKSEISDHMVALFLSFGPSLVSLFIETGQFTVLLRIN